TCSPAARSANSRNASATKVSTTPPANNAPDRRDALRSPWGAVVSDNALMERIGKTHGIKLRINPPASASSTAAPSVTEDAGAGTAALAASSNAGLGPATTVPANGTSIAPAFARAAPLAKPSL